MSKKPQKTPPRREETTPSGAVAAPRPKKGSRKHARSSGSLVLPIAALLAGSGGAYFVLTSCGKGGEPPQPTAQPTSAPIAPSGSTHENAGVGSPGLIDPTNGGDQNIVAIPGDPGNDADAGPKPDGPQLGAAHFVTGIYEKADWESKRIGYMRAGGKVAIRGAFAGEAVPRTKTSGCKEGWVPIEPRGYVCLDKGGGALNLEQPNVKMATAPANFDELLPYKYGFNGKNGVPLYRRVPTVKEWQEKEPWTKPKPKVKPKPKPEVDLDDPYGIASSTPSADSDAGAPSVEASEAGTGDPVTDAIDAAIAENADAGPWWERDAGKGEITLKDTMGDPEGLVARRMVKGFAIAIDRTFIWSGRSWYRTTQGLVAPSEYINVVKPPEFKGVELGTDWQLPIAWSLVKAAAIFESKDKKTFTMKDTLKKQTPIRLLSPSTQGYEEVTVAGIKYLPTFDGRWVKERDVAKIDVSTPPADLKPGEKWIDVSIKAQALVAYEGDKPVFATLVSTGRDGTNVKGEFATVQGSFRIREKHVAATMDGDTSGELYSIEDVPYIQYFHTSYALHGAFWHSDYGHVRSHGCVNLSPADAKRLFMWTEPKLPPGWHGVWATDEEPGTRVITRP